MPTRTDDPPRTAAPPEVASTRSSPVVRTPADPPLTHESFRAIFSSHQRSGRWEAADEIEVQAIAGDVTLDFTRAELPPSGMVEIEAWSICGNVKIVVPDGAEVVLEGTPFLGSIEQSTRRKGAGEHIREWITGEREADLPAPAPPAEPPYFHVDAHAILGNIEVTGR